jgi:hypothetical protein
MKNPKQIVRMFIGRTLRRVGDYFVLLCFFVRREDFQTEHRRTGPRIALMTRIVVSP